MPKRQYTQRSDYNFNPPPKLNQSHRGFCGLCGQPADVYHDSKACTAEWQRKCDEEARKVKEGARP